MPTTLPDKRREMTAAVLIPDTPDFHNEVYSEEEVLKGCRNFQEECNQAYIDHNTKLEDSEAYFVENYVTKGKTLINNPKGEEIEVPKGTWLATMKFKSDRLWNKVESGEYTGFSIHARCKALDIIKSKAGAKASEEGATAKTRLFDFRFEGEKHHVSLVGEAANAEEVLAIKYKEQKEPLMTKEEIEAMKARNLELESAAKELEVSKAKEAKEAKEAAELEVSKAKEAKEAAEKEVEKQKEELEKFKAKEVEVEKARVLSETEKCVTKAKDLLVDDADVFGKILFKMKEGKSLESDEYEAVLDQLGKLTNVKKAKEVLKDKGEVDVDGDTKDEYMDKYNKLVEGGMEPYKASIEAAK